MGNKAKLTTIMQNNPPICFEAKQYSSQKCTIALEQLMVRSKHDRFPKLEPFNMQST